MTLYLDGVAQGDSLDIFDIEDIDNDEELYIGCDRNQGNNFNGSLDEVMIFDKALTSDEVTAIYNIQRK